MAQGRMVIAIVALLAAAWLPGTMDTTHAAVSAGTVYGWGINYANELGPHPEYTTSVYTKVHLPAGVRFTSFAGGASFSLALASNGTLYGWGSDSYHTLGVSRLNTACNCTSMPIRISFPAGVKIKAIASGGALHALALAADGRLFGWGNDSDGELGSANSGTHPTLIPLPNGVRARAIAAGWDYSLALGSDGHLYAWGANYHGQLGTGGSPPSPVPTPTVPPPPTQRSNIHSPLRTGVVPGLKQGVERSDVPDRVALPTNVKITAIAAGEQHSLALATDGSIYAWGRNEAGQVGDGTTADHYTPARITLPGKARAISIAAGPGHSLAIASDGTAYEWGVYHVLLRLRPIKEKSVGKLTPARVKLPKGVKARTIAAGNGYSLVRGSDGAIYAWGDNTNGELGDGSTTGSAVPVRVHMPSGVFAKEIATAESHNLVLGSNGTLYAWGENRDAELGGGDVLGSNAPVPVRGLAGVRFRAVVSRGVAPDGTGDVFLRADGAVQTWDHRPVQLPRKARATAIAIGYGSMLALAANGQVYAWGTNTDGQLGTGSTARQSSVPVRVHLPAGVRATAIADGGGGCAGGCYDLAATSTGAVYAWGDNTFGQLGTGNTGGSNVPVLVHLPAGVRVTGVAAGGSQSMAVTSGGGVYVWGSAYSRPNVIGTVTQQCGTESLGGPCLMIPARLRLPSGFKARTIAAGFGFDLVMGANGAVYAWGSNTSGQLGIGRPTSGIISMPERVHLPAGVKAVAIATGMSESMAITTSGDAYGWGANGLGQLGIGRVSVNPCNCVSTPTRVHFPVGLRMVSVALGTDHTLAVIARQ